MQLSKQGSSLEEFEAGLRKLNSGEGVLKVASELNLMNDYLLRPMAGVAGSLPGLAFNASAAAGSAAGLTFDELESSVLDLNRALDREREKVHMVRKLTDNIKKEHGLQ